MQVAILGAGPAGMSCANVCLSYGLTPVVIERSAVAGGAQRVNFHPNLWMLGAPDETGSEMTSRLARHFDHLHVTAHFATEVVSAVRNDPYFTLTLNAAGTPRTLTAAALVLATGTRARATAEIEALAAQCPRVAIGALAETIRDDIHSADVLIVGGGDNALDHALFLAERGNRVTVRTRAGFSARRPFVRACAAHPAITLVEHAPIPRPHGDERGVWFKADNNGEVRFDWMLVMYGYRPNTDVLTTFAPELRPELTPSGHLRIDTWQRTSVPYLYAAGDLTDPPQPSVPTAIAQGLAAARAIEVDLHRRSA